MFEPQHVVLSRFRLDGGAMFGAVPRVLWERERAPDAQGRVDLVGRGLLLVDGDRRVLVDAGVGHKFDASGRERFCVETIEDRDLPFAWNELTDVIPTHLHFDHGGGLTRWSDGTGTGAGGEGAELVAPQARVFLQRANWDHARAPGPRERGSYLPENVEPLESARLELVDGAAEVLPGVRVGRSDGHTRGMQWVLAETTRGRVAFPSDLVPTASHLHLPWGMGYDMWAERLLEEKEAFLEEAVAERWIVVFAHDAETPAGRVGVDARGRFVLAETVTWGA